jgi:hypothetical protein
MSKKVTKDVYLLRFIYDHYKYNFIATSDLQQDIGWDFRNLCNALDSLRSWGFFGDQSAGPLRSKKGWAGTGICLDEKYATEYFMENNIPKPSEMINPIDINKDVQK